MLITCNWHVFYYTLAHFFPDFRLNYFLLTLAHFARSTNHPHRHHGRHRWVSSTMPVLRHQKPYTRRLIPSIHSIRPGVIIAAASDHQPSLHLHQQATMMGAGAPSPLSVMPPTYQLMLYHLVRHLPFIIFFITIFEILVGFTFSLRCRSFRMWIRYITPWCVTGRDRCVHIVVKLWLYGSTIFMYW